MSAADSGLSEGVKRFLAQHIQSVEQLEILLLVARTAPKDWSAEAIALELRVAESSARARLGDLERRGLVLGGRNAFRFAPQSQDAVAIQSVADAYRERRVAVIEYIFSRQTTSIQALADAFKVK